MLILDHTPCCLSGDMSIAPWRGLTKYMYSVSSLSNGFTPVTQSCPSQWVYAQVGQKVSSLTNLVSKPLVRLFWHHVKSEISTITFCPLIIKCYSGRKAGVSYIVQCLYFHSFHLFAGSCVNWGDKFNGCSHAYCTEPALLWLVDRYLAHQRYTHNSNSHCVMVQWSLLVHLYLCTLNLPVNVLM